MPRPRKYPEELVQRSAAPGQTATDSARALPGPPGCSRPARRNEPCPPHRSRPHKSRGAHQRRSLGRPIGPTPSLTSTIVDSERENDTDRYELAAQSRRVAGAAERKARARSPSRIRPTRLRSPNEGPCPGSPEPMAEPGRNLHEHFHAARSTRPAGEIARESRQRLVASALARRGPRRARMRSPAQPCFPPDRRLRTRRRSGPWSDTRRARVRPRCLPAGSRR
jgi:hypothetical protein